MSNPKAKAKRKMCLPKTVTKNLNYNFCYCLNLKNFVNRSKFACSLRLCRCSKFGCHGLIKIVVVSCCLDLNQSPPVTNDKLKNQRTKNVKPMWALVKVLSIKHNNFCLTVMNHKLSKGIAGNVGGFMQLRY